MSAKTKNVEKAFALAEERYASLGVNVNSSLAKLSKIPISLHCWQGDDVGGFENFGAALGGGLAVTGNYPGKARTPDELRADLDKALSLIPGKHRLNLHAFYGEFGGQKVDRNEVGPEHFKNWIAWAKANKMGMDFNPTYFAHPKAKDGFTLSHSDKSIRKFWIEHGILCREIGAAMGKALGTPCVTNVWIPDGYKDTPVDRKAPRERLAESLDAIFAKKLSPKHNLDAVEPKLFGIGSESYVAGSHEFYLGYAVKRNAESRESRVERQIGSGRSTLDTRHSTLLLCLDAGHYHPTEGIADKISSVLLHLPEILLHVSRGVRWDSDHVVILNDDLQLIAQEIVRNGTERVHIGLDYFDASINRVAAWTIGTRNMLKALLMALLEPGEQLKKLEVEGDFTGRLVLLEELKSLPFGAVWDYYCLKMGVPVGESWLGEVKQYEKSTLSKR